MLSLLFRHSPTRSDGITSAGSDRDRVADGLWLAQPARQETVTSAADKTTILVRNGCISLSCSAFHGPASRAAPRYLAEAFCMMVSCLIGTGMYLVTSSPLVVSWMRTLPS